MSHSNDFPAQLLKENLSLLTAMEMQSGVLDLACGRGRNGLFLAQHNVPVIMADNNDLALQAVAESLRQDQLQGECWKVDLEVEGENPLQGKCFDAVVAFNYLHRPLFTSLRNAIKPGGLIFYETFTLAQRKFGRPNSAAFLLRENELLEYFQGWEVIHYFEGQKSNPDRAIANLIARRP